MSLLNRVRQQASDFWGNLNTARNRRTSAISNIPAVTSFFTPKTTIKPAPPTGMQDRYKQFLSTGATGISNVDRLNTQRQAQPTQRANVPKAFKFAAYDAPTFLAKEVAIPTAQRFEAGGAGGAAYFKSLLEGKPTLTPKPFSPLDVKALERQRMLKDGKLDPWASTVNLGRNVATVAPFTNAYSLFNQAAAKIVGKKAFTLAGKKIAMSKIVGSGNIAASNAFVFSPDLVDFWESKEARKQAFVNSAVGWGIGALLSVPMQWFLSDKALSSLSAEKQAEAEKLYKDLARRYHPDVGGTEESFKAITKKLQEGDIGWLQKLVSASPKQAEKILGSGARVAPQFGGYLTSGREGGYASTKLLVPDMPDDLSSSAAGAYVARLTNNPFAMNILGDRYNDVVNAAKYAIIDPEIARNVNKLSLAMDGKATPNKEAITLADKIWAKAKKLMNERGEANLEKITPTPKEEDLSGIAGRGSSDLINKPKSFYETSGLANKGREADLKVFKEMVSKDPNNILVRALQNKYPDDTRFSVGKPTPGSNADLDRILSQTKDTDFTNEAVNTIKQSPEITRDVKLIDPTDVKKKANIINYLSTPDRVLEKIGLGGAAKDLRAADEAYRKERKIELDRVNAWYKKVPEKESSTKIFKYLDGKSVELTPKEKEVGDEIREYLKGWADRLELPEDKRVKDYITHLFDDQLIQKEFDPELAKMIDDQIPQSVWDPFLQKRYGIGGYKEDVWGALDAYVKRATRKVNMDPALDRLSHEGQRLDLESWKYVKNYADKINLRPTELDNLIDNAIKSSPIEYRLGQRPVAKVSRIWRKTVANSAIGLNIGSATRNLTQGINTYAKLGEKYTVVGYTELFKNLATGNLKELEDNLVLEGRIALDDRTKTVLKGATEKTEGVLWAMFDFAEKINRGSAYYGAKSKALNEGKSPEAAIEYAKKIVRDTQFTFGSIDTPLVLSSDIAKTALQFQSFNIKQAEFLTEMAKNKDFKGLIRFIAASFVMAKTVGKLFNFGVDEAIPFINGRFSSPFTELLSGLGGVLSAEDLEGKKQALSDMASKTGILAVPAGVQLRKTIKGIQDVSRGYSATKTGRERFSIEQTPISMARAAAFGIWTLPEAREYVKNMGVSKSQQLLDKLEKYPIEQQNQMMAQLKEDDKAMFNQVVQRKLDQELKITKKEKNMRSLPVKDGQRARAIVRELKKMDPQEQNEYMARLVKLGVVSDNVRDQLINAKRAGVL